MSFTGGCLCGAIRYGIERNHLNAIHCHCAMCRRAHGGAFSTHVVMRADQLHWTRGSARLVPYASSMSGRREFCPDCGTHLLVHGQTGDATVSVPAGTLDDRPPLTILGHMYTEARVPWYVIRDSLPQHRRWPRGFGPETPAD